MKHFQKMGLFRLLCLSAILVLALAACGPSTGANNGAAGTPGVSDTTAAGGSSVMTDTPAASSGSTSSTDTPSAASGAGSSTSTASGTDLTGTPSSGTGSSSSTSTAGGSTDLTGTPSTGTDLTGTPSVSGTTDLTGTPSAGTSSTAVVPVTGGPAVVNVSTDPTLGKILVDGNGMTLYTTSNDTTGTSNCTGACLQNWPPLMTNGAPVAGAGVDATLLGTIAAPSGTTSGSGSSMDTSTPSSGYGSSDTSTPSASGGSTDTSTPSAGAGSSSGSTSSTSGAMIVTYKGMPLYTYIQDTKPGDVNGKGVGGNWSVAVP